MGYRFLYRQSARSAGVGMMVGPPLLAAAMIAFTRFFPDGGIFTCIFVAFLVPLAGVFFVIGLRRVIFGGYWGCFIDDEYMTWVFPQRMGHSDQQVFLRDIGAFVVQVERTGDELRYSYFIETTTGRLEITVECFGRLKRLGRALVAANPAIKLKWTQDGECREWDPEHLGRLLW